MNCWWINNNAIENRNIGLLVSFFFFVTIDRYREKFINNLQEKDRIRWKIRHRHVCVLSYRSCFSKKLYQRILTILLNRINEKIRLITIIKCNETTSTRVKTSSKLLTICILKNLYEGFLKIFFTWNWSESSKKSFLIDIFFDTESMKIQMNSLI